MFEKRKVLSFDTIKSVFLKSMFGLWLMHLVSTVIYFSKIEALNFGKYPLLDLFYFEYEKNLPAFFSAFLLLSCGYLLLHLSKKDKENNLPYKSAKRLGYVFFFLACDEWFSIHEILLQVPKIVIPFWLYVYIPLAILVLISSIPFLKSLPARILKLTLLSGFLFISGAVLFEIGIELFSIIHFMDLEYQVYIILQEATEMAGSCLFAITLMQLFKERYKQTEINVAFRGFVYLFIFCFIEAVATYISFYNA